MPHNWSIGTLIGVSLEVLEGRRGMLGMNLFNVSYYQDEKFLAVDGSLSLQLGVKVYYGSGVENTKTTVTKRGD